MVLARHRPVFEVAERKVLRDGSEVVRLREETYRHFCEKRSSNQLLVGWLAGGTGWLHACMVGWQGWAWGGCDESQLWWECREGSSISAAG